MAGGSPESRMMHQMEQLRHIAVKSQSMYVFYTGPVSKTEYASGYRIDQHQGWCIPLQLHRQKGSMSLDEFDAQVFSQARLLRVLDDGTIRRNYNDANKWWVMAPPPNQKPVFGIVARAQPPNRAMLNVVPYGKTGASGGDLQQRAAKLREGFGAGDEQDYVSKDDVWVETIRIKDDGSVEFFPKDGTSKALLKIYKELFEINAQGTKFSHDPSQTTFGGFGTNPMSESMPSTVTVPVQTYIPVFPEFLTVAAMAIATAKYLNESGQKNDVTNTNDTRDIAPTEFLHYEDLKREAK